MKLSKIKKKVRLNSFFVFFAILILTPMCFSQVGDIDKKYIICKSKRYRLSNWKNVSVETPPYTYIDLSGNKITVTSLRIAAPEDRDLMVFFSYLYTFHQYAYNILFESEISEYTACENPSLLSYFTTIEHNSSKTIIIQSKSSIDINNILNKIVVVSFSLDYMNDLIILNKEAIKSDVILVPVYEWIYN